jgi:hypothetical protein
MNPSANELLSQSPEQKGGCGSWLVRDGRLRSGWRVTLYIIIARLVQLLAAIVFGLAIGVVLFFVWSDQRLSL